MNYQELVEELAKAAAQIATETTLKTIEEQRQADAKAIKDRRIHNTKLLLRKYRLFNEHIGSKSHPLSRTILVVDSSTKKKCDIMKDALPTGRIGQR